MSEYQKVNMPIQVPMGEHCWDGKTPCDHFDNEGGHGHCHLGFCIAYGQEYKKPVECLKLKVVET